MSQKQMTLPERVRLARQLKGWTQQDLAWHADISIRTVSQIEMGHRSRPHRSTVKRLYEVLGLEETA